MADEALSAGAVARRLGVAVTTLRTWHQRYGLGPSRHEPGQHRRYTEHDLHRLEVMLRLTTQGVAPAEAAAWARRTAVAADADADAAPAFSLGGSGGGQTIAPAGATPAARGLARAAIRLDVAGMRDILATTVAQHGVIHAWDQVAMPVLIGVGERYESTQRFVEVEHLLSRCVTEVLGAVPRPAGREAPRVLLTAADEEQHTLALEALAAALAEAGVAHRLLGGRVPPRALDDAVARTGPAVVVVWSQLASTGDPEQLSRLTRVPNPPLLIGAAGPGWPDNLPPEAVRLSALPDAVRLVRAAVAPGP